MSEKILYEALTKLLNGEEINLEEENFGEWTETVQELMKTPAEWRGKIFQSFDKLHRGELTRLLATYQPPNPALEQLPPEAFAGDCPELPANVRPDPDLAARASPWLDEYVKFSQRWSPRSYTGYHEVCGLWLLSTIAARRVAYHFGDRRYTNLYLILAGTSTLYAKTRAARIAIDTLNRAGLGWLRAPDRATPQAFLSYLTGKKPENYDELDDDRKELARLRYGFAAQRGWFYEEFGSGISAMTKTDGYMADFRGLLREFDDCPERYEYITKTRGAEVVRRPYLAMLANLTPADLRPVAHRGASIWGDGFLARFSFITPPDGDICLARFPTGERAIPETIIQPLRRWHQRLGTPLVSELPRENIQGSFLKEPTVLEVTSPASITYLAIDLDVIEALYAYNFALLEEALQLKQEDLVSSYARLHEKALRVAALLASLEGYEAVNLQHWFRGQQITETWRGSLHRIYEQITNPSTRSAEAELEQRVIEITRRLKNPTAGEMTAYIKSHSVVQISRVADSLVEIGVLQLSTRTWGRRTVKRYSLIPDETKENTLAL